MKTLLVTLCLLTAALAVQAQKKPGPLGVYMVLPVEDQKLDGEPCWTDNNVLGVRLRANWGDIETSRGVYDWSYFVNGLQKCKNSTSPNGKYAVLSVDCGRAAPTWIVGPTWTLTTPDKGTFTLLAPWGAAFQARLAEFLTAFGQKFDGDTHCVGIAIWAGGYSDECFFAVTQADTDALYKAYGGPSIWLNAAETAAAEFAQAFPTTQCYVQTGVPYLDNDATMTTLASYCQSLGMGLESNALSAGYPNLNVPQPVFPHTILQITTPPTQVPLSRYQLLYPIGTPRMNGATLSTVLSNGLAATANNVEIYPSDPTSGPDAHQGILNFNEAVGAP